MDMTKMQCRVERSKPTLLYVDSTYTHADTAVRSLKDSWNIR